MTRAMAYILTPLMRIVMRAKETAESARAPSPKRRLRYPGTEMRLRDIVERHHDDAEEKHRGDGADPIPMRGKDAVLVGGPGPAHQFQRAKIRGDEAKARDPRRHLATREKEFFACVRRSLDVEADEDHQGEIDHQDQDIGGSEMGQLMGVCKHE